MADKPTQDNSSEIKPAAMLNRLSIGDMVQISSADNSFKYLSRLVGCDGTRTLITPLPSAKQLKKDGVGVVYDDVFFNERPLVMRIIADGNIYAFKSHVSGINYNGCKLLLSNFPSKIQSQKLRRDARYPCTLPANCQIEETHFSGVVINISRGGCQLQCHTEEANTLLTAKDKELALTLKLTSDNEAVTLKTTVMSVTKIDDHHFNLGIAFQQSETHINDYLNSLQLGEMSKLFL